MGLDSDDSNDRSNVVEGSLAVSTPTPLAAAVEALSEAVTKAVTEHEGDGEGEGRTNFGFVLDGDTSSRLVLRYP